jgi:hypothetical protein
LVKENQEIIDETKKLVKADIMHGMIAVVLDTDMDEDGILSDREIQRSCQRMRNVPAIKLKEKKFERK